MKTWQELIEAANEHAASFDCEVRLTDPDRESPDIRTGASPVGVEMLFCDSDGPEVMTRVNVIQVAVLAGIKVLKVSDPETGRESLIGATGINLFRTLYVV